MRSMFICFYLFLISTFAFARNDLVGMYGVSTKSCASFLAFKESEKHGIRQGDSGNIFYPEILLYREWLSGYVTAFNVINLENSSIKKINTDTAELMTWLRIHCEKNPTQQLWLAANELLRTLSTLK